jgi:hypothetical protein
MFPTVQQDEARGEQIMNSKTLYIGTLVALLTGAAHANDPYALEPSINGGVSASGLFASQAEEERDRQERFAHLLEPCINGEVSARGRFTSHADEGAVMRRLASN